jgi:hypothetical protein
VQNNRIEMLEMQLRKKDEEVTALAASVTVRRAGGAAGAGVLTCALAGAGQHSGGEEAVG